MKIDIQYLLSNSYVLSIDKNRQSILCKCFNDYEIPITHIYQGFSDKGLVNSFKNKQISANILTNAYNCSLGHAALIKLAKCLNLPFICIFEDDAYPRVNIKNELQKYLNEIPDDADVIALGWSQFLETPIKYSSLYYTVKGIFGSHAYIIFQHAYDRYLDYYTQHPTSASDDMLYAFNNAKFYITSIPFFIQYNKNPSNWGCVGYTYEQNGRQCRTLIPPKGFEKIETHIK